MAPHGGLFVYTTIPSMVALGTRYGPHEKHEALAITAVELDAYAPPSSRMRAFT